MASSSYAPANFASGEWGTVTCAAGNNVAWLQCATFDACKIVITSGTANGVSISASYWGIQGFEVDNTSTNAGGGTCFQASAPNSSTSIHHVIFANNVVNQCPFAGIGTGNNRQAGVDYIFVLGNSVYAAALYDTSFQWDKYTSQLRAIPCRALTSM